MKDNFYIEGNFPTVMAHKMLGLLDLILWSKMRTLVVKRCQYPCQGEIPRSTIRARIQPRVSSYQKAGSKRENGTPICGNIHGLRAHALQPIVMSENPNKGHWVFGSPREGSEGWQPHSHSF